MSPLEEQMFRVVSATENVSVTVVVIATVAVFACLILGFGTVHIVDVLHSN